MLGLMRPPAKIKPWLNPSQLTDWVCAASIDAGLRRKRLAVWLSAVSSFYAHQVAALLGVSVVSVWRWITCYNRSGPEGLRASRRGGRRRGHLGSRAQEASVLAGWEPQALAGNLLTAGPLRQALEQAAGRRLSPSSLYELLARHDWRKVAPRGLGTPRMSPKRYGHTKKNLLPPGRRPRPGCASKRANLSSCSSRTKHALGVSARRVAAAGRRFLNGRTRPVKSCASTCMPSRPSVP
jgi:transposase